MYMCIYMSQPLTYAGTSIVSESGKFHQLPPTEASSATFGWSRHQLAYKPIDFHYSHHLLDTLWCHEGNDFLPWTAIGELITLFQRYVVLLLLRTSNEVCLLCLWFVHIHNSGNQKDWWVSGGTCGELNVSLYRVRESKVSVNWERPTASSTH